MHSTALERGYICKCDSAEPEYLIDDDSDCEQDWAEWRAKVVGADIGICVCIGERHAMISIAIDDFLIADEYICDGVNCLDRARGHVMNVLLYKIFDEMHVHLVAGAKA